MNKLFRFFRKAIDFCIKIWRKVVAFVGKREFVLTFPLMVFTIVTICTLSKLAILCLLIWIIVFATAKYEE